MHLVSTMNHRSCVHMPHEAVRLLRATLNAALRGKGEVIEQVLACLLAGGHILLEDLPGTGKTTLARTLARAIGGRWARLQCTPDLLPGDITGFNVFNPKTREFNFVPGPVFADVLLVDEINRATPRTQSALLEAMGERQVTVDNVRYELPDTFMVIATQNPIEQQGTYPLPEAQLDRFAMKLRIGYPGREDEIAMLAANSGNAAVEDTGDVLKPGDLQRLQAAAAAVAVARPIQEYLVDLAAETRRRAGVAMGVSPRGLLIWQRLARARAFLRGRDFVIPDDVQDVARPVLEIHLVPEDDAGIGLLDDILASVPVPACERRT